MNADLSGLQLAIASTPTAHFGAGGIHKLGALLGATGCSAAVVITDAGLLATPVIGAVRAALDEAGIPAVVFGGVHPNPTTDDVAAGAEVVDEVVAELAVAGRASLVAVGGGSSIDAAKGIALAAVNVERGRDLDYRNEFAQPGVPIVAVPTTAGTGAETNAFGVVTDPLTRRKFYVGHASTRPASAILDPELTVGLPPAATAATGVDALTHAIESYLSVRANPWSDGIALQVIAMAGAHLARSVADGSDLEARSAMLLASHMAGIAMGTTGLGLVHAIGHAIGGRHDLAHGVTLAMVLPQVLRFTEPARRDRLASIAFALGVGDTAMDRDWNAASAIDAVTSLRAQVGLAVSPADFGIGEEDFAAIAASALADEVLANAPRQPCAAEIEQILAAAGQSGGGGLPLHRDQLYQRPAVPPAPDHQGRAPGGRRYRAVDGHTACRPVGGRTSRHRAAPAGRARFRPAQPASPCAPAAEPARVGHHRPDQVR
jgi:alcohol dehydrogenase class IV